MKPQNPQFDEGDKMERANNTLLRHMGPGPKFPKNKEAKEMFERNITEHAVRTTKNVKDISGKGDDFVEVNAESINRARRGEPSKYNTDKDLSK